MRSSNKRSRSKSNRPKTLGNIVNRVFDSSGPEGKVRGTPQQIIDKYMLLARDAQLGGDRVAAENFLQHAEHYTRMLSEAQRELAREAETRRDQHQPGGGQNRRADQRDDAEPGMNGEAGTEAEGGERRTESRNENRGDNRGEGQGNGQGNRRTGRRDDRHEGRNDGRNEGRRPNRDQRDVAAVDAPAVDPREALSGNGDSDSMLVETPESRREQRPVAEATPAPDQPESADTPAGETPKPRKPRAPAVKRSPRKPKSDEAGAGGAEGPGDAPKAAE